MTIATKKDYARDEKGVLKASSFASIARGFKTRQNNEKETLQFMIVEGFRQYDAHGNTVFLTQVMGICAETTFPSNTVRDYIKANANVKWAKDKAGNMVFKKEGGKNIPRSVTVEPGQTWYEYKKEKTANNKPSVVNGIGRIESLIKTLESALEADTIPADQVETVRQSVAAMKASIVTAPKAVKKAA